MRPLRVALLTTRGGETSNPPYRVSPFLSVAPGRPPGFIYFVPIDLGADVREDEREISFVAVASFIWLLRVKTRKVTRARAGGHTSASLAIIK